jgi:hypothetical protein
MWMKNDKIHLSAQQLGVSADSVRVGTARGVDVAKRPSGAPL